MNNITTKSPLIIALDTDNIKFAKKIIDQTKEYVHSYKIGLQLFSKYGYKAVENISKKDVPIFLDLKFYDIPNTVQNAVKNICEYRISMFTVHTLGGAEMMKVAKSAAQESKFKPKVLGVTILTSIDEKILNSELKIKNKLNNYVLYLAKLAKNSGLDGVVASPKEIKIIRKSCGDDFIIVTPGIRISYNLKDDQKRTDAPDKAINSGANFLVIGRPILKAENPKDEVLKILNLLPKFFYL